MNKKAAVKFRPKSWRTIICSGLLGAALLNMSGCAAISGRQIRAANAVRENKTGNQVKTLKDFAGKWHRINGGQADYAVYAENLGSFESYQITEDGRVKIETSTAARSYDCLVESSAKSEGNLNLLAGSQLNIRLAAGTIRKSNACSPEQDATGSTAATTANYQWQLGADEDGRAVLCLTPTDGETACYRRED